LWVVLWIARAIWTYQTNLSAANLAKYGIQSMASPIMDTHRFSQMLAKIAHSYAAAVIGLDGFEPLLVEHILGEGVSPWHLVGGTNLDDDVPATDSLHEKDHVVQMADGTRYLTVRVRLFAMRLANFRTPLESSHSRHTGLAA